MRKVSTDRGFHVSIISSYFCWKNRDSISFATAQAVLSRIVYEEDSAWAFGRSHACRPGPGRIQSGQSLPKPKSVGVVAPRTVTGYRMNSCHQSGRLQQEGGRSPFRANPNPVQASVQYRLRALSRLYLRLTVRLRNRQGTNPSRSAPPRSIPLRRRVRLPAVCGALPFLLRRGSIPSSQSLHRSTHSGAPVRPPSFWHRLERASRSPLPRTILRPAGRLSPSPKRSLNPRIPCAASGAVPYQARRPLL